MAPTVLSNPDNSIPITLHKTPISGVHLNGLKLMDGHSALSRLSCSSKKKSFVQFKTVFYWLNCSFRVILSSIYLHIYIYIFILPTYMHFYFIHIYAILFDQYITYFYYYLHICIIQSCFETFGESRKINWLTCINLRTIVCSKKIDFYSFHLAV